ncbi:unnamed protein product [Effrenium voratum]|nr:unnamed protein product [Effrenium voratum]
MTKARARKRTESKDDRQVSENEAAVPRRWAGVGFAALAVAGLGGLLTRWPLSSPSKSWSEPTLYGYRIVKIYKHDAEAFTQGLLWANGSLFESTGLNGRSSVRELQLNDDSGDITLQKKLDLDGRDFGEGLVHRRGQLLQLLWRTGEGIRYEAQAGEGGKLRRIGRFRTPLNDGWGIEFDGDDLLVTDSGHDIFFLDPADFEIKKKVSVMDDNRFVEMLNELEMIGDELWANVYGTDCLARIDKTSGSVTGWVLLHDILDRRRAGAEAAAAGREAPDVLNGIAWDPAAKRLFVTGKLWPTLYEIKVEPLKGVSLETARKMCIPKVNIFQRR